MKDIECQKCGFKNQDGTKLCSNCYADLSVQEKPKVDRSKFSTNEIYPKNCAKCGEKLRPNELKCEFCRTMNVTEKIDIRKTAFSERIYDPSGKKRKWFFVVLGLLAFVGIAIVLVQTNKLDLSSPVVYNDAFDESVYQVKDWLKNNLKDPGSVEYVKWSRVTRNGDEYVVSVKLRAKNSFGAYTLENMLFTLSSTGVIEKTPITF